MKHRFRGHRGLDLGAPKSSRPGKSPLIDGVLTSNIDTTTPGSIRIALWREWRALLDDLPALGPVWSIVRNGRAVLAVRSDFPKLAFSQDQQHAGACNGDRSLDYHLPAWKLASVANEGISQTARMDVERASEAHGWLVLSGKDRSLYVESAPTVSLYLEPGNLEGEQLWRLSLLDPRGHRLLRLQSGVDGRESWNQLIREIVLT